ncbi:restriction endonuclease [Microbulbifer sp. JSM ZJ756]|uniref:restriction endonuclease n=1 Tax=Microbulbifer sp. JSM ZJ756 TaxID=3376191 RepID=UPI0037968ADA
MAVWLVRAGGAGEREDFALENNCVVIGWLRLPDLSSVQDKETLKELLVANYPDAGAGKIRNWAGQIWSFCMRIDIGDLVVLPLKSRSSIAIGRVTGSYRRSPDGEHQRPVEWLETDLPRSRFDQDILYSFGAFLTVCQIKRNNAEERINAVLSGGSSTWIPPVAAANTVDDLEGDEEEEAEVSNPDLEQIARDQIRSYIGQKFRGHDFSRLVAEILKAQGFKTKESPPGADGGIDIIAGKGPMGFDAPRLAVQVKSSDTALDVTVLRELQGVMRNFGADNGLIVSWGGFKSTTLKEAAKVFFEVRLWDSDDVVRFVQEHYDSLPDSLQAELPLKPIWVLVPEDIA